MIRLCTWADSWRLPETGMSQAVRLTVPNFFPLSRIPFLREAEQFRLAISTVTPGTPRGRRQDKADGPTGGAAGVFTQPCHFLL